jgi:hypothetical protein
MTYFNNNNINEPEIATPESIDIQNPYCDNINTNTGKNSKLINTKYIVCMLMVLKVCTSTPA